jgi:lipopolysaccharide/colanic/teichoic acid biosynthesis glycosyltransferase
MTGPSDLVCPSPGRPGRSGTFYATVVKRLMDLAIAGVALLVFSPFLLVISLLIFLEDRGPVFYRQERVGRDGRAFRLTKFRSMVLNAEHIGAGILVERNDRRITRIGALLRKLSLDEIPQFFDVLRGDMSVVGPRPGLRYQAELYDDEQRERLAVRPGITGWAQIKGRNAINWPERIRLDRNYIDALTLGKDLEILFGTIPAVLSGSDQIADADYWKTRRAELEQERNRRSSGVETPPAPPSSRREAS